MYASVGSAEGNDARSVGNQAAKEAATGDEALVYVFASSEYDLPEVVGAVDEQFADVPVVGCSSTVEVADGTVQRGSVVVGALNGDDVRAGVGIEQGLDDDSYAAGRSAMQAAFRSFPDEEIVPFRKEKRHDWAKRQNLFVTIFADPLHGVGVDVLEGINDVLGPGFSTTGQFAADDMAFERTLVFHDGEVHEDAVVTTIVEADNMVGSSKAHGFKATPNTYRVTEAEKNEVRKLDDRPPAAIYEELFGEDNARDPGFLLMTPFGLRIEGEDEHQIRVTLDVDDQGCYHCGAAVPEGETVQLLRGEKPSLLDAASTAASNALEDGGIDEGDAEAVLVFSCVGRDAIYDDPELTQEEIDRVRETAGEDATVFGLYGFGQIATSRGWAAFNEETLALQVIGREDV